MDNGEPPSSSRADSLFRVGKNSRGNWVVQDQSGLCGGMFVNRAEAVKFAMFENGNRPQAMIMVPGILELDMSSKPRRRRRRLRRANRRRARRLNGARVRSAGNRMSTSPQS